MSQRNYRVVESSYEGSGQIQRDIGCEWKTERAAKEELKAMKLKQPDRWLSIQKRP